MRIPAPYHQGITNEWRNEWEYGQGVKPTPEQYEGMKKRVYEKYPLPSTDNKTNKVVDATKKAGTIVIIGIALWEVGKWTIAVATAPAILGGSLVVAGATP